MHVVKIKHNLIYVAPVPEGLRELLTFKKIEREPRYDLDPVTGARRQKIITKRTPVRLYSMCEGNALVTFGGMYNRVRHFFESKRIPVEIKGQHPTLPPPDWSRLPSLRHKQDQALAAIATYPRGLILAATAFGKTFLCGVVGAVWPTINILLVADALSVCDGLSEQVLKHVPEENLRRHYGKYLQHKREQRKDPRIIVTSMASMGRIRPNWPDLILFDEAHVAPSQTAMDGIMQHTKPKIFGLTASPEGRSDGADDMITALFGDVVVDVEYQESVEHGSASQIIVYMVHTMMDEIEIDNEFERDAVGIWRNDERSKKLIDKADEIMQPDDQILYYTSTLEHALRIRKLFLPNVPIAHAGSSKADWRKFVKLGLVTEQDRDDIGNPDVPEMERLFRDGRLRRVICTPVWKKGTDFPDLRCLVRFDGTGSEITSTQVPGRAGRVRSDGTQKKGIVIDSMDDFGQGFLTRSRKRIRTYKKKGWQIINDA